MLLRQIAAATALAFCALGAGPLDPPPGPIAPTGRTLLEIEPRIPVGPTTTPGDVTTLYRITAPGSYYLTGNVVHNGDHQHAISIQANNVTLDLSGFSITGPWVTGIGAGGRNNVVRNGQIVGTDFFGLAITGRCEDITMRDCGGLQAGDESILINCHVTEQYSLGIVVGDGCILTRCSTGDSTLGDGIRTGDNCVLRDCMAYSGTSGIQTGDECTLTGCIATSEDEGFIVGRSCVLSDCTASATVGDALYLGPSSIARGCTVTGSHYYGIVAATGARIEGCSIFAGSAGGILCQGEGVTVSDCLLTDNGRFGIQAGSRATIVRNTCTGANDGGAPGAPAFGIEIIGTENHVEGNVVRDARDIGILVTGINNVVVRNTAMGNPTNYSIVPGNLAGPIITSATIANDSSPHANYSN